MADKAPKGSPEMANTPAETAISQIVQMNPRRVTVALTLPVARSANRPPVVTLEWSREDTTMPLGQLLARIETYVTQYGMR